MAYFTDYAKLMRKRDKAPVGPDGKPTITIESLRASTASARGADPSEGQPQAGSSHHQSSPAHHPSGPASPYEGNSSKGPPPTSIHASHHPPHPGPYQLMPVSGSVPPSGHHHQMMPPPPPPPQGEGGMAVVPPPPWIASSTSVSSSRGYAGEHQSYMRTPHRGSSQ